jgi:Rrf2 family protein
MEVILNELKHGGFVESKRGNEGGYMLARNAKELTVGEVVEYVQGPISVAPDVARAPGNALFFGDEAFKQLWREVNSAVSEVCENRTFADLVEFERAKRGRCAPNYSI